MSKNLRMYLFSLLAFVFSLLFVNGYTILLPALPMIFFILAIKNLKQSLISLFLYFVLLILNFKLVIVIYMLLSAGLGTLIGYLFIKKMDSYKFIMTTTVYIFFLNLANLYSISKLLEKTPKEVFKDIIFKDGIIYLNSMDISDSVINQIINNFFLGISFASAIIISVILFNLVKLVSTTIYKEKMESIKYFKIEGFTFFQFIALILILVIINKVDLTYGNVIFSSGLVAIFSILILQGYCVLYFFISKKIQNKFLAVLFSIILAFVFPGVNLVLPFAVLDLIFNFRKI